MRVRATKKSDGFALIVTITLLILLSLIAVGLLSLSTVTLRSSQATMSVEMARANAKLSLQLALGRLQGLAGPDTRITAPANSAAGLSGSSPYLTGVWRSWEGLNHDPDSGMPIAPPYDLKLRDGSVIDGETGGRFLGWLVSSDVGGGVSSPPDIGGNAGSNRAILLGNPDDGCFPSSFCRNHNNQ